MPAAGSRELLDRIRPLLPDRPVREVPMFGAIAVMLDDAMVVAVHKDASMLVRVDPSQDAQLLERPHASRAEMGAGRSMGAGWLRVDAEATEDHEILRDWVGLAVGYVTRRCGDRQ